MANHDGVTAWGSWGYPVELSIANGQLMTNAGAWGLAAIAPYIYRRGEADSDGGQLILTDLGLFRAEQGNFERLPLIDDQYQLFATDFATRENAESALGKDVFLVAEGKLYEISVPVNRPRLAIEPGTPDVFDNELLYVNFDVRAPVGPPEKGRLKVAVSPDVPYEMFQTESGYHVTVPHASDRQPYVVSAVYLDAAGQASDPQTRSLMFVMPWYRDPLVVAALTGAILVAFGLVLRNRYVADFVVRGILGRRWHVTTGKPERTISLSMLETGYLSAEIETEGATLRGKDIQAEKVLAIGEIRARMLELSKNPPASDSQAALSRFGEELKSFAGVLDAAVPPLVAHELRSHEHSELQFELDRSLSAVPWDLLTAKSGDPLMIGTATARVIVTDSATATPKIQGALSAVVFAADDDVGTTAEWRREQQRIASTLRKAGVRRVSCPSAEQSKEELLDEFAAADVLHLIGHGEIGENGEVSFRVGPNVLLSVAEIRHGLLRANRGPALVFLNACGSVQERTDGGGKVLAGLATPFLEAGSIVVGSFWPVQSAFAASLAVDFYREALPRPSSLVFRVLSGRALAGQPFSQALRDARRGLFGDRPYTNPTWSAYTMFGNSKARFELR